VSLPHLSTLLLLHYVLDDSKGPRLCELISWLLLSPLPLRVASGIGGSCRGLASRRRGAERRAQSAERRAQSE
jgi:hypothetical protein